MSKILTMLKLQLELNNNTAGIGWESGLTTQGKKIDWKRCIYLEAAELVESYPWKHWKNIDAKVDKANAKVELVDIWHFVLSEALRVAKQDGISIEELSATIQNAKEQADAKALSDYYEQIEAIEVLIKELFCNFELSHFTKTFFELIEKLELSFDELYNLYIGKNILNAFRQQNGYKDGSYIKIWNGKEENVVMQEILEKLQEVTPETLMQELAKEYPKG